MDDLLAQLAKLPIPTAVEGKRKRKATTKAMKPLEERLDQLEPVAVQAKPSASEDLTILKDKADRFDKARKILSEQISAEAKYRALESQLISLLKKK
jgi:hypothetical protein